MKKKLLLVLLCFLVLPLLGIVIFFYEAEAPILQGKIHYDIPFKEGLALDIYDPTNKIYDNNPVIYFFHGGGFVAGRKETINMNRFNASINQLREAGYTVICPEYTLASDNKSPFPDCIYDAYDVIEWGRKNAIEYQLDSSYSVMGESAGAHLALILAYAHPDSLGHEQSYTKPQCVIDVYGPVSMPEVYRSASFDSLEHFIDKMPDYAAKHFDLSTKLLGFQFEDDSLKAKEIMNKYSPIEYLNSQAIPSLIIHGTADIVIPYDQSLMLKSRLDQLAITNEFLTLEGVNHAFIGANETQKEEIQKRISRFVQEYHKMEKPLELN